MPDEKKEPPKEEPLVPVGEGADMAPAEERPDAVDATGDDDDEDEKPKKKVTASGEEEEERVGHGEDEGEDREAIKARRRKERQNRRAKAARLEREVNFLRQRNENLERGLSQVATRQNQHENLTIDQRISTLEGHIATAEGVHSRAVTENDGAAATEALAIRDKLRDQAGRLRQLKETKATENEEAEEETAAARKPATVQVDPVIRELATEWLSDNSWFDKTLKDEKSYLVKQLEDRLTAEGEYDPRTSEYWEELTTRVDRLFPGLRGKKKAVRNEDDDDDDDDVEEPVRPAKKKTNGGPKFMVGGKQRALGKNEVHIDAERRKALEDAGVWDDEETRNRYLKAYKTYDQDARSNK